MSSDKGEVSLKPDLVAINGPVLQVTDVTVGYEQGDALFAG